MLVYTFNLPVLQVAVDLVLRHSLPYLGLGEFGQVPESFRALIAKLILEFECILALAATDQAAVAARGAKADALCFEQHHVEAPFSKIQCCRQTGKTATDDTDIGAFGTFKYRQVGYADGRRDVIAVRIHICPCLH